MPFDSLPSGTSCSINLHPEGVDGCLQVLLLCDWGPVTLPGGCGVSRSPNAEERSIMLNPAALAPTCALDYVECDGKPMSDNTLQFRWIIILTDNLTALFVPQVDVFVSGNQMWYPIEGEPEVCTAPDVYVVFGRPKGYRGSYKQWEEANIPMTVVFEIVSPTNTYQEMADKFAFYEEHGVLEYYVYDPEKNRLEVYLRQGSTLVRIRGGKEFVSPRLGIRFELTEEEMIVRYPNGDPFIPFEELKGLRDKAEQRATQAEQRADKATKHAGRLRELVAKSVKQEATAEELAELQSLLEGPPANGA
jgi:Uma2 family endonuclease